MSYDIELRRPRPGYSGDLVELFFDPEGDGEDDDAGHPYVPPLSDHSQEEVAALLIAALPELVRQTGESILLSAGGAGMPSPMWGVTPQGVTCTWNYGWSARELAKLVDRAWIGLRVLVDAGFVAFDPQTGELVDLETGRAAIGPMYAMGNSALSQIDSERRRATRPWWRFW